MDPERSTAPGVAMLRGYLHYAASGGETLSDTGVGRAALTPFDVSVRDRLVAAGVPVVPKYGVAGHWIDFAALHPADPDRMLLAIESDGAAYHSAPTARDRDRLRQEQLGRLGWSFHRIWSADWFADPDGCVARAQAAYHRAARGGTPVLPGRAITDYTDGELVAAVQDITADGRPRTDDELYRDFIAALGFAKRGQRIRAAFDRVVRYARVR
jgi:very-short-patch-repair endonuclease